MPPGLPILALILNDLLQILDRDDTAEEKKPEVLKHKPESKTPNGTRSFSTMAPRRADVVTTTSEHTAVLPQGHIFGLPALPIPARNHLKYRYEPIVQQVTGLIMKSGKLGVAQRVRSSVPLLCHVTGRLAFSEIPFADDNAYRTWLRYSITCGLPHHLTLIRRDL